MHVTDPQHRSQREKDARLTEIIGAAIYSPSNPVPQWTNADVLLLVAQNLGLGEENKELKKQLKRKGAKHGRKRASAGG